MKNFIFKIFIVVVILLITLLTSCTGYQQNGSPKHKNLSYLYNPNAVTLHPEYSVYHINGEKSELNVKILKNELFFVKSIATKSRYANIDINYKIYNSFKTKVIADTGTVSFNFKYHLTKDTIILSIPINLLKDSIYSSTIYLTDQNRERTETNYLFIDKRKHVNENFKIKNTQNSQLIFNNNITPNNNYIIESVINKGENIYVSYYNRNFPKAYAPFSTSALKLGLEKADSTWLLNDTINFSQKGLYILRTDTNKLKGKIINIFSKNFPKLSTPTNLIKPIRYLTSKNEYNKILEEKNRKVAIDRFWLNRTGHKNRAKELLRIYYTRVNLANKYFTSYKQGWKTDRGIIYMIYGDPTIVYKSDVLEKWIYGENQTNAGLMFLFERNKNSFSQNDYILTRSVNYKQSWYQAVDTWRNGRAFAIVN